MTRNLIFALLIFLCFTPLTDAIAQSIVNILRSDRVQAVQTEDGLIRKLSGNVHLRTNDIEVRSDSAWHYVDRSELHGFGNLRIDTENETIWADKIIYDIEAEISSLSGMVIIESSMATIYSETALYSFLSEIALFNDPIWLEDNDGVMQAMSGIYFNQNDSVVFRGDVQLADSTQYIEADSIFTIRSSSYYQLHGRVFMVDNESKTAIKGDYVEADSTGKRFVEGGAIMRRLNSDETDTTWLAADRIDMNKIDTFYVIDAVNNVESWQKRTSTLSDSLNYDERTERFELRSNPKVWYDQIQLSGNIIDIQLENDTLKTLFAKGDPFATQQDSITLRFNQMKGDSITIYFLDDNVDQVFTGGNAEILLHYKDDEDQPDGAINIRSDTITIYFEDGEVADLKATSGIDGETLSESTSLAEMRLNAFSWDPHLRPLEPDVHMASRHPSVSFTPPFVRTNAELGSRRRTGD